ncbi:MAG TPA: diguanylate cyclase [Candidatus Binatia bacterium]|nr:diguanylate cyclase [Candidatus Binatia bacterium]
MPPYSPTGLDPAGILLVEDRLDTRSLLRVALESAGHHVTEAGNLAGAREALRHGPAELVLCGIQLGAGESGIVLLRELAPRSPDIAVVMLTGDTDTQVAIDCLRDGAFDYLLKGFQVEELGEVIARTLRRQRRMVSERQHIADQIGILSRFTSENPNPVLRVTRNGVILYANAACQMIFGELNCRVGEKVPRFLDPVIADVPGKGEHSETQVEIGARAFSFMVSPIKDADYFYLYGHDITRLKETERELVRLKEQAQPMALHDPLTGLPNRTLLQDRLVQAIAQSVRLSKKLALAFFDLDNFKPINDAQGHQVGDQILVEVARRLSATVRKTDTVARWGGDELILLLPGLNAPSQARAVCERVKHLVQEELARNPLTRPLTISMGVAIYPDDASLPEVLLQQADTALYQAKARGRNRVVMYGESGDGRR